MSEINLNITFHGFNRNDYLDILFHNVAHDIHRSTNHFLCIAEIYSNYN